jgi:hypothetical protein
MPFRRGDDSPGLTHVDVGGSGGEDSFAAAQEVIEIGLQNRRPRRQHRQIHGVGIQPAQIPSFANSAFIAAGLDAVGPTPSQSNGVRTSEASPTSNSSSYARRTGSARQVHQLRAPVMID